MIRAGSIRMKFSRDENEQIRRYADNRAIQAVDHNGWPEYEFRFSSVLDLDCKFEKDCKSIEEQVDKESADMVFDALVHEFAMQLGKCMKYKNYKNLEKHGINPNMVFWDK